MSMIGLSPNRLSKEMSARKSSPSKSKLTVKSRWVQYFEAIYSCISAKFTTLRLQLDREETAIVIMVNVISRLSWSGPIQEDITESAA